MASIQPGPTCDQGTAASAASTPWAAIVGELSGSADAMGGPAIIAATVAVAVDASVVIFIHRPSGVRRRGVRGPVCVMVVSVSFGNHAWVSVP